MASVLGLGNALVDILCGVPNDDFLNQFDLPKGSMQLIDENTALKISQHVKKYELRKAPGGSAANTINGLSKLGVKTGFIGKIGNDEIGNFFKEDMVRSGIIPNFTIGKAPSGRALVFVTPDSERTFATYLGAAIELVSEELEEREFKGHGYFHIEGYLVQNHELVRQAVKIAKKHGLKVTLDLASYNVVEQNMDFLDEIIRDYVDIVFANQDEAKAFTGLDPEGALSELAGLCDIAVVKVGRKGSLVQRGKEVHRIGIIDATPLDKTGAGDLYASGFIYGLINKYPLNICGEIGSILSGKVIEVVGPKMDDHIWDTIKEMISEVIPK
jgi:sugar/nucleoside kinase (ribokinase family)